MPGTSGNYPSAPYITAYKPATTWRVEARLNYVDWSRAADEQAIFSTWSSGGGSADTLFRIGKTALLEIFWEAGLRTTAGSALTLTDGQVGWAAIDVTLGSGDAVVTFYESTTNTNNPDLVVWSTISTHSSQTLAVAGNDSDVNVGAQSDGAQDIAAGSFLRLRLIVDSVVVFDPRFDNLSLKEVTAGSFIEDSSNAATVTLNGTTTHVLGSDHLLLGVG